MTLDEALATIVVGPSSPRSPEEQELLDGAHDLLDTLGLFTMPPEPQTAKEGDDESDGLEVFRTQIPTSVSLEEACARFDGIVPAPSEEDEDGVYMGRGGSRLIYLPMRMQVGFGPQVVDVAPSPVPVGLDDAVFIPRDLDDAFFTPQDLDGAFFIPQDLDDALFIPQDLDEVIGNGDVEARAAEQADLLVDDAEWDAIVEELLREDLQGGHIGV